MFPSVFRLPATGEGKRFIFADNEEEDVAAPTVAVAAPTVAAAAPTTAVVHPGRERVAALQSAALGLAAMAAQPPLPALVVAVREQEVQTDPWCSHSCSRPRASGRSKK